MAIEPIKGFYVHDEVTDTDGIAKYDAGALENLDRSLTERYRAPDSKAVGDRLSAVEAVADEANRIAERLNEGGLELKDDVLAENISAWLNGHPEATTTVEDGALTQSKLSNSLDARKPSFYSTVSEMQEDEQYRLGATAISDGAVYTVRSAVEVNDPENMVDPSILYKYDGRYYHGGLTEDDRQIAIGYECVNGFALFVAEYKNAYVTPELFGAKGDGVTDDTLAMKHAIESGKVVCGDGLYLVSGLNIVDGFLFHVHLLFKSSSTLVGKLTSLNSIFERCIFESTNDQEPSWGQGEGLFSNVHISTCNSSFHNCRFVKIEHVSTGNIGDTASSEYSYFSNCKWIDCASGITGSYSNNVSVNNCTFELLTYTNSYCHAIYVSNDCENWHISGCSFYGCKHYVFSISNNHTYGENPKDVFISDCVVDDAIEVINATADNVIFSNLELLNEMPEKFFLGGGKTTFYNSKIVGHAVFHVPDNETFSNGETFYNEINLFSCSIKSDYEIIYPQRTTTNVGVTNINSNNCVWECGVFSDSRSVRWVSNGDTLNVIGNDSLFDNLAVATEPSPNSVFVVNFFNGSLNIEETAKIVYGFGGNYSFKNVSITGGNGAIFNTRSADRSTVTISLNNVSFAVLGSWVAVGTSGEKHNVSNDKNYNRWKEIKSFGRVSDVGTTGIDLDGYDRLRLAFTTGGSSANGFVEFKNTDEEVRATVFSSVDYYLSIKGVINNKTLTVTNIFANGWSGASFGLIVQGFRE